jgi:hypothetical protein
MLWNFIIRNVYKIYLTIFRMIGSRMMRSTGHVACMVNEKYDEILV